MTVADPPKVPRLELVVIEWQDHCGTGEWIDIDDLADYVTTQNTLSIYSVGWIAYEDDVCYALVSGVILDGRLTAVQIILKAAVISKTVLAKGYTADEIFAGQSTQGTLSCQTGPKT
jgi:hypothetical protein